MRRAIVIIICAVVTFLVQGALRVVLPSQYILPDLIVIFTCSMGLTAGKRSGMWSGFLCGLLYDLFYGNLFGVSALVLLYAGYASGALYMIFFDEDIRIPLVTVAAADIVFGLASYAAAFAGGLRQGLGGYFIHTILPQAVATVICAIVLYYVYRLINLRMTALEGEEQHSPWLRR